MKKTILLSSILAVGAAFAVTVDSTEIGVLGIDKPTANADLIAVPFEGYDAANITVADMVNTAELEVDTELYVPNASGKYDVWKLNSDKEWTKFSENVVIGNGGATAGSTPDAAAVTTTRGSAFWLKPPSAGAAVGTCYLLGKPVSGTGSSALESGKWNLVGNTSGEAKTVPAGTEGEKVCVPTAAGGLDTYTYRAKAQPSGGWAKEGSRTAVAVTIQSGQGFWYLSKGTASIAW